MVFVVSEGEDPEVPEPGYIVPVHPDPDLRPVPRFDGDPVLQRRQRQVRPARGQEGPGNSRRVHHDIIAVCLLRYKVAPLQGGTLREIPDQAGFIEGGEGGFCYKAVKVHGGHGFEQVLVQIEANPGEIGPDILGYPPSARPAPAPGAVIRAVVEGHRDPPWFEEPCQVPPGDPGPGDGHLHPSPPKAARTRVMAAAWTREAPT